MLVPCGHLDTGHRCWPVFGSPQHKHMQNLQSRGSRGPGLGIRVVIEKKEIIKVIQAFTNGNNILQVM